ncbi:TPA: hypothetical protein ACGG7M_003463 [Vibrio cholerae]
MVTAVVFEFSVMRWQPLRRALYGISILNENKIDGHFLSALFQEDDLGAVIRVHLNIESQVNKLLSVLVPFPDELKPIRLDYFGKVHLISALGIEPEKIKVLLVLGKMRNKFAHDINYALDKSAINNLYESLDLELKVQVQNYMVNIDNDSENIEKFNNLSSKDQFIIISVFVRLMLERAFLEVQESSI